MIHILVIQVNRSKCLQTLHSKRYTAVHKQVQTTKSFHKLHTLHKQQMMNYECLHSHCKKVIKLKYLTHKKIIRFSTCFKDIMQNSLLCKKRTTVANDTI